MTTGVGKGFAPSAAAANTALGAGKVRQAVHPSGTEGTKFSLNEMAKFIRDGRNDPRMRAWAGQCIARAEAEKLAKHVDFTAWIESDKLPTGGFTVRAKTKTKELASANGKTLTEAWQELASRLRGAANLTPDYGKIKSNSAQAQAILNEIRRVTYYVQDPINTELMAKPHVTLCLEEHGLCMPSADCDDRCIAFASATMAIGIETKIVGQAYGTTQATHVICAILDPDKGWQKVDPSSDKYNVGDAYPATKEWWMDPISGSISESADGAKTTLGQEPDNGDFIGVGAIPAPHAFAPGAGSASYVPVGLESGLPCEIDGTECGDDQRVVAEIVGVGVFPMAHAFAPGADSASYVPVGMESGLPCEPDGQGSKPKPPIGAEPHDMLRGVGARPRKNVDSAFAYRLVGLGETTTTFARPSVMPDFSWNSEGGYWISDGESKPTMNPVGQMGEWLRIAPYGRRLSGPEELLVTPGSWRWIWYPKPLNVAHWLNSSVWAVVSSSRPAGNPTPIVASANTWMTTAADYWIWVYDPTGVLHA